VGAVAVELAGGEPRHEDVPVLARAVTPRVEAQDLRRPPSSTRSKSSSSIAVLLRE